MERAARQYWKERLDKGTMFHAPDLRREGMDYKLAGCSEAEWPKYVSKESLYLDFTIWNATRYTTTMPDSEFYRLLERFLYPYGRQKHTRRMVVYAPRHTTDGRVLQIRQQRAFIKMPDVAVMRAVYRLAMNEGTQSEKEVWRRQVINGESAFASVARGPQSCGATRDVV